MKRRFFFRFISYLLSLPLISSCTKVPVTNRTQLNFVPDKWIRWISDKYYYDYLDDNLLIQDVDMYNRVYDIGIKIQIAIKRCTKISFCINTPAQINNYKKK